MIWHANHHQNSKRRRDGGFTLVEMLVVLFIFMLLAAVALPTVRNLIADQKVASATRNLAAYIDIARNTAIANSRPMGVLFQRVGGLSDVVGRAAVIRLKQISGVPAYVGESSNSVAYLANDPNWPPVGHELRPNTGDPDPIVGLDTAVFDANDSQLLYLSATMIASSQPNPPIRRGDLIEFPGGRVAPIEAIIANPSTTPITVTVHFDLNENFGYSSASPLSTQRFPSSSRRARVNYPATFTGLGQLVGTETVKYKVHRRPVVTSAAPMNLPRGVVIDMNYSGIGDSGNQFAPVVDATNVSGPAFNASNIALLFGPDGKVINISNALGNSGPPTGLIFFCVGDADGVRPFDLLSTDSRATANLLNLDSTWLVINPSTGRVAASPNSAGAGSPPSMVSDPYAVTTGPPSVPVLEPFISSARSLALLSDTLDAE